MGDHGETGGIFDGKTENGANRDARYKEEDEAYEEWEDGLGRCGTECDGRDEDYDYAHEEEMEEGRDKVVEDACPEGDATDLVGFFDVTVEKVY